MDWGNPRQLPAHCLCITSSFMEQCVKGMLGPGGSGKNPSSTSLCGRGFVSCRTFTGRYHSDFFFFWIFFKPWNTMMKMQVSVIMPRGAGPFLWRKAFWFSKDFSCTRRGLCISVSLAKGASPICAGFFSDELFMKLQSESLLILSKITIGCFSLSCCY